MSRVEVVAVIADLIFAPLVKLIHRPGPPTGRPFFVFLRRHGPGTIPPTGDVKSKTILLALPGTSGQRLPKSCLQALMRIASGQLYAVETSLLEILEQFPPALTRFSKGDRPP